MRRREQGSTLVFTLSILGLLAALAAVMVTPLNVASRRVDLYYRNLQARELCAAGVEQALLWATRGVVTNAQLTLGAGTVDVAVEQVAARQGRLRSVGRVAGSGNKAPVEQQTEMTMPWP